MKRAGVRGSARCRRHAVAKRTASLNGMRKGAGDLSQIGTVIHGTTVGTNALLERKGGKAGVIATEGFRDVLEMRRRDRPQTWGLWGQFEPVVPRERRVEARERVLADGTVRTEVDREEIVAARARSACARRRGGRRHVHQLLCQSTQRADRSAGAEVGLAECVRQHFERDPARDPRVRADVDDGAQRLSAAGRRRLSRSARSRSHGAGFCTGRF